MSGKFDLQISTVKDSTVAHIQPIRRTADMYVYCICGTTNYRFVRDLPTDIDELQVTCQVCFAVASIPIPPDESCSMMGVTIRYISLSSSSLCDACLSVDKMCSTPPVKRAGVVIGFREWAVEVTGEGEPSLAGVMGYHWRPGPNAAKCNLKQLPDDSACMLPLCRCGMYMCSTVDIARDQWVGPASVLGAVIGWGPSVRYKDGWRTAYAQIIALSSDLPVSRHRAAELLDVPYLLSPARLRDFAVDYCVSSGLSYTIDDGDVASDGDGNDLLRDA